VPPCRDEGLLRVGLRVGDPLDVLLSPFLTLVDDAVVVNAVLGDEVFASVLAVAAATADLATFVLEILVGQVKVLKQTDAP
jgi:hypothetical protein